MGWNGGVEKEARGEMKTTDVDVTMRHEGGGCVHAAENGWVYLPEAPETET